MSRTPESRQNPHEVIRERLQALQVPLGALVAKASGILDEIFPYAPHPLHVPEDFPVIAVSTANAEPGHELTIRFGQGKFVRIDKNPLSATPLYPLHRLWYSRPEHEAGKRRRTEILEYVNKRAAAGLPFDINTSKRDDTGKLIKHLGCGYEDQGPTLVQVSQALDEARGAARMALGLQ